MDDVKENEKSNISVSDQSAEAKTTSAEPSAAAILAQTVSSNPSPPTLTTTDSGEPSESQSSSQLAQSSSEGSSSQSSSQNSVSQSATPSTPAPTTGAAPAQTAPPAPKSEQESELVTINALLLIALAAGMFYVGTVVFAADSLLFFAGIFVYLIIAPPGTYAQGKSKMVSFTKEVAIAFALSFVLFLILKALMPPDADQAKWLTFILFILGAKLVFNPYYNFKSDD